MRYFVTALAILIAAANGYAFTYYQKGQSPSELLQKGNRYQQKNFYSTKDNLNAYSSFQNPYDANSARNNSNQYGEQVKTYDNQKQGLITPQVNSKNSIVNPYGKHGNVYGSKHPSNPYTSQKWNNPYSHVQNPYGKNKRFN